MRGWQQVSAIGAVLLMLHSTAGAARAQSYDYLPPLVASVLAKLGVLTDNLLGALVVGNTLTDPKGQNVAAAVAQIVVNFVNFFAELVALF